MDEGYLATARVNNSKCIHIAELSRQSVIDSDAEHLGFGGYFLFETDESKQQAGINVLARLTSLEAAFEVLSLWRAKNGLQGM